jgi:penicillin-insensitive murein endopeptidase
VTLPAHAQDPGTLNPQPLPPLPNPSAPKTPANECAFRGIVSTDFTAS